MGANAVRLYEPATNETETKVSWRPASSTNTERRCEKTQPQASAIGVGEGGIWWDCLVMKWTEHCHRSFTACFHLMNWALTRYAVPHLHSGWYRKLIASQSNTRMISCGWPSLRCTHNWNQTSVCSRSVYNYNVGRSPLCVGSWPDNVCLMTRTINNSFLWVNTAMVGPPCLRRLIKWIHGSNDDWFLAFVPHARFGL